jgi:hypothetical protein
MDKARALGTSKRGTSHRGASHRGSTRRVRPAAQGSPGNAAATRSVPIAYLLVLGVVALGLLVTWHGSTYAGKGTGLVGCALLAAALARLVLPPRYLGMLACRGKAFDVAAYALLGGAVLGLAFALP